MAVQSPSRFLVTALFLFQAWFSLVQCQDHAQLVSGDVMLAAMASVNFVDGDGCGTYDVSVLKRVQAVTWFLDALNDMDYFGRGIKLGLTVYRTCQSPERAVSHAVDILNHYHVMRTSSLPSTDDNSTVSPLLGLLGPDRTAEAKVVSRFWSSLPPSQRPLEISASATGEALADRALYSNLFRVIPPDSTQVQVLLKLLQALHWNYIGIIYDDHDYGRLASEKLRNLTKVSNICVPYQSKLPLDSRTLEFSMAVDRVVDVLRDKLIKGLVYIGTRATAKELLIKLGIRVSFPRFIFSEGVGLQSSVFSHVGRVLDLSKGAFVASPPTRPVPKLRARWNGVWSNRTLFLQEAERNPWLAQYFRELTSGCTAEDEQCWTSSMSRRPLLDDQSHWLFEYYNVKAVAVFAALFKKLVTKYCQGHNSLGLCSDLSHILKNERHLVQNLLQTSSFDLEQEFFNVTSAFRNFTSVRFDETGEIVESAEGPAGSLYDVYNFIRCQNQQFCFKKVGSLRRNKTLQLTMSAIRGYGEQGDEVVSPNLLKAQCSVTSICAECLPSDIASDVIVVPGDFYFVAVLSAHDRDRSNPLGCGDIRTSSGADMVQSVLFSLQQVNSDDDSGVFRGRQKLGVIVLNACFRELVIKQKLLDLYSGRLMLPDGRNSSAILPHIAGYVGAYYSTISVAAYEVLSKLNERFVMLSPTSSSPNLSDRTKYPYFLRMITKSEDQAKAMLSIVTKLNASYIQVIYDEGDEYSMGHKDAINRLSQSAPFNVCVIHNVNVSYDDDSLDGVRERLLQYSWVPVVIVLLQYELVMNFTDVVTTNIKPGQFLFIGSETWEVRPELLDPTYGREKKLEGSLVVYQGLPVDKQFDDYFKKLDPFTSSNPWLKYFWEATGDCYFQDSFAKKGRHPCPVTSPHDLSPLTQNYIQSVWVPFFINAVKAFAQGLHRAMVHRCHQTVTLCEELTSEDLVVWLKSVRMDMTGSRQEKPVFDQNGDGGLGYDVYQIQRHLGRLTYVKVGSYHDGRGTLTISSSYPKSGHCLTPEQCHHCFPRNPSGEACSHDGEASANPGFTAFIVIVVILSVIVIICCIVVALYFIRRRRSQQAQNHGLSSSLRRLQSLDNTSDVRDVTPVPESCLGGRQRNNSSTSSICTCGGGGPKTAGCPGREGTFTGYSDPYDYIHQHHPNVRLRQGDAAFSKGITSTCLPPPPPLPPLSAPTPSRSVCSSNSTSSTLHDDYVSQDRSGPGPFITFANEMSAGDSVFDNNISSGSSSGNGSIV